MVYIFLCSGLLVTTLICIGGSESQKNEPFYLFCDLTPLQTPNQSKSTRKPPSLNGGIQSFHY
ncbi:hypothetical protein UY3_14079 [Chelonia mydas]|uniref:Secreted protein n=1 Tax=Chelonia mydas TaxID=8469 RepID=M7B9J2_CHEMY|nr:hypothetical protein UY3_14079 [Chelonia mydas]